MAAAARKPPTDQEKVARIVQHMNADHQDSLVRYLEHYCGLSSYAARNARLVSMSKTSLQISTGSQTHTVKLESPLADWSEARPRVVAMDATCIASLKRSPITLKQYIAPRPVEMVMLGGILLLTLLLHKRSALLPLSAATSAYDARLPWPRLASSYPDVFSWLHAKQPWILWPLVIAHAFEATLMGFVVLRRHSVPVGSSLWRTWVVSTFLEGFPCFGRVRRWVASEAERREKSAH